MQIIKQKQTNVVDAATGVTIYEYVMSEQTLGGSTAIIGGRYPEIGHATNTISKELAYVLDGEGIIGIDGKETHVEIGDCIYIEPNEKFYWNGSMVLFMVCTPAFKPEQHIISI